MPAHDIDDFDIRQLRYFLAVARSGSVSAAAEELGISQPSMSQQIRRLECRVGASLFIRSSLGMRLTDAGQRFRLGVQAIPGRLRSAVTDAAAGRITWVVGVCNGAPSELLAEVERELSVFRPAGVEKETSPRVKMKLVEAASQPALLLDSELSFGITYSLSCEPSLIRAIVWDEPFGIVMGTNHPLAARTKLGWSDLASQRLLWRKEKVLHGESSRVLDQLTELGWGPSLELTDYGQKDLFAHILRSGSDLVALCSLRSVQGHPLLTWRALPTMCPPHEQFALTVSGGGVEEQTLRHVAAVRHWMLPDV